MELPALFLVLRHPKGLVVTVSPLHTQTKEKEGKKKKNKTTKEKREENINIK